MAGRFVNAGYERDDATIGPIKVQQETLTTWNTTAPGVKTGGFVKARGSKKSYGLIARYVTLSRVVGDGTDYNSAVALARVPVLSIAKFTALSVGDTVAYQNKLDWKIAAKNREGLK